MKRLLLLLLGAILVTGGMRADDFDPLAANIEENIANPAVPAKASEAVSDAMNHLIRTLKTAGYRAEGVRKGEVVMVTIPCASLFAPNETELMPAGVRLLAPLMPYIKRADKYKVIIAVHADNTGDELYAERLTADRANAIDEYIFHANGGEETGVIPYGLGSDEPVASNTGVLNRAKNRRVEIYFVPTAEYIDRVQKHKAD